MKFTPYHHNHNVVDLDKSIKFYQDAFGMHEARRMEAPDGSYTIVFLQSEGPMQIELTWLRDWNKPAYELGDNEQHIAFRADDFAAAHKLHSEMGCICLENEKLGVYFVTDPDGYWLEVVPVR